MSIDVNYDILKLGPGSGESTSGQAGGRTYDPRTSLRSYGVTGRAIVCRETVRQIFTGRDHPIVTPDEQREVRGRSHETSIYYLEQLVDHRRQLAGDGGHALVFGQRSLGAGFGGQFFQLPARPSGDDDDRHRLHSL